MGAVCGGAAAKVVVLANWIVEAPTMDRVGGGLIDRAPGGEERGGDRPLEGDSPRAFL